MKRIIAWGVGVGCLVGALTALLQLRDGNVATAVAQTAEESTALQPAPAAPDAAATADAGEGAAEGTIVHRFADEAGMDEFATLWQRRQAALTRMAVLQAYWEQEQPGLNQVNQQLLAEYQLDVSKSYRLDAEQQVLVELPTPAQPVPTISSNSSATPTPSAGSQP